MIISKGKKVESFLNGENKTLFLPLKIVNFLKKIKQFKEVNNCIVYHVRYRYNNDPNVIQNRHGREIVNNYIEVVFLKKSNRYNTFTCFYMDNGQLVFSYSYVEEVSYDYKEGKLINHTCVRLEKFLLI